MDWLSTAAAFIRDAAAKPEWLTWAIPYVQGAPDWLLVLVAPPALVCAGLWGLGWLSQEVFSKMSSGLSFLARLFGRPRDSDAKTLKYKAGDRVLSLEDLLKTLPPEQRDVLLREVEAVRTSPDPEQRKAADQLVSQDPEQSFETLLQLAAEKKAAHDIDGAVTLLLRAGAFATLTAPKRAVLAFEDALALKPGNFAALFHLVFLKLSGGDTDGALHCAEQAAGAAATEQERISAGLALAHVKRRIGDNQGALADTREATKRVRALLADNPTDDALRRSLGEALQRLGDSQAALGDLAAARSSYEECYVLRAALSEEQTQNGDRQRELIIALSGMAAVLAGSGDLEGALLYGNVCQQHAHGLAKANPNRPDVLRDSLLCSDQYASYLRQSGNLHEALPRLLESARQYRLLADKNPDALQAQIDLKNSLLMLSEARELTGDIETALGDVRAAVKIAGDLKRKAPRDVLIAAEEITARRWQASVETRAGNLKTALDLCDQLQADVEKDKSFGDDLTAAAFQTRATARAQFGDIAGAFEDYTAAADLYLALHKQNPTASTYEQSLLYCRIEQAELRSQTGDLETALSIFDGCIHRADDLLAQNPKNIELSRAAAWVRQRAGARLSSHGDSQSALNAFEDAYKRYDALANQNPRDVTDQINLAWTAVQLSATLRIMGKLTEARTYATQALSLGNKLRLGDTENAGVQTLYAQALDALANVEASEGRLLEQLKLHEQALKVSTELANAKGASILTQRDLAVHLNYIGQTQFHLGRMQEAEENLLAALENRQAVHDHLATWEATIDLANAHLALASLFDQPTKTHKAQEHADAALHWAQHQAAATPSIAAVQSTLGLAHARSGDIATTRGAFERARAEYQQALEIVRVLLKQDRGNAYHAQDMAAALSGLGEAWFLEGRMEEALEPFKESLKAYESIAQDFLGDHWSAWNVLWPRFRIAQIENKHDAQLAVAQELQALQGSDGRGRVGLHFGWLIDIRKLLSSQAN